MELSKLLTVVVPCKNEQETIKNLLSSLNSQHYVKDLNVIIADVSDDNITMSYIESEKGKNCLIKVIEGGFPAVARHNGAKLVDTPYILFLDSDMVLNKPTLLSTLLNEIIDSGGWLLTCKVRTTDGSFNHLYRMFDVIQGLHYITKPFALGGVMLFKTSEYFNLGGFNPDDLFAEDYALSKKVPSNKFILSSQVILTEPRRFYKKGVFYIVKMMVKSFINQNNKDFFKKTHSYWS